jgi:hypothetical protein
MLAAFTPRQKLIIPLTIGSGLIGAGIGILFYQRGKNND